MNRTLPPWLERLLGIDPGGAGEGTSWSLQNSWGVPAWLTVVIVLIVALGVTAAYVREIGTARTRTRLLLAGVRITLVSLVLLMIAQWVIALQRTDLPIVVFFVDGSRSMSLVDRYGDAQIQQRLAERLDAAGLSEATRWNLAGTLFTGKDVDLLRSIAGRYKLKVYRVGAEATGVPGDVPEIRRSIADASPDGDATHLGDAIRTALSELRGNPIAAIVLISDGVNTGGRSLADAAASCRRKGIPMFTVAVGSDQRKQDVRLTDLIVDDVVFVDDNVNLQASLSHSGFAGREVELVLRAGSSVVARRTVTLDPNGRRQPVRISLRPQAEGTLELVLEATPLEEETDRENNRTAPRVVTVRKQVVGVLMAQSRPSFEFRYLKQMLERDKTVKLTTVLQEGDPGYASQDDSAIRLFPVRRDELFQYDVIILGDVDPQFFSRSTMSHLTEFVSEKGGGLIFIAGPQFMPAQFRDSPLAALMPLDIASVRLPDAGVDLVDGFRVRVTEIGGAIGPLQLGDTLRETDRIWSSLPELYWSIQIPKVTRDADGKPFPLILLRNVGPGRVLFHGFDESNRWRIRAGDRYFARYWVQMIRYLARSKLLGNERSAELTTDENHYDAHDPVVLRLRFYDQRQAPAADQPVTVVLQREGEKDRVVRLEQHATMRGIYEARVQNLGSGSYHGRVVTPAFEKIVPWADFSIGRQSEEDRVQSADTAALALAAERTGGRYYHLGVDDRAIAELPNHLPEGFRVPVHSLPAAPLWNHPLVPALFLLLIGTEWILRKYHGML